MLEHHLFGSAAAWGRQLRPMILAIFSYRYDAELVPDLLANVSPAVDGWVAFDDRASGDLFSSEPRRRRLLIERARSWAPLGSWRSIPMKGLNVVPRPAFVA